jgi:hypothetical protein
VGLDQLSFLCLETHRDPDGSIYDRYVSVGRDESVYVFDKSGRLIEKRLGEELEVPGTKIFEDARKVQA